MHNEPTLIGCRGYHHIPPICGFALWGAIEGLITNQLDLIQFLEDNYRHLNDDWLDPVEDILNDPPGSPADGEQYIVGCSPTGDWVGQEGNVAEWKAGPWWDGSNWQAGNEWSFVEPREGTTTFVKARDYFVSFVEPDETGAVVPAPTGDYLEGQGNNSPPTSSTTLWDDFEPHIPTVVGTAIQMSGVDSFRINRSGNYKFVYSGDWSNILASAQWGEMHLTVNNVEVPGSVVRVAATGDGATPTTVTANHEITVSLSPGDIVQLEVRSSTFPNVYWTWDTVQIRIDEMTMGGGGSATIFTISGDEAFWLPHHYIDAAHDLTPLRVIDRATTPPGDPGLFDTYLVITTATGDWAGYENYVAISICDKTSGDRKWVFLPPIEGELVYVPDEDVYYIYDGATSTWRPHAIHVANNHILEDVSDVTLSSLTADDILIWDGSDWINITPQDFADLLVLGDIGDVTITSAAQYNVIWWDGSNWVNVTPATLAGQILFNDLGDVDTAGVVQYNIVWFDGTNWVDVTPSTFANQININDLGDVNTAGVVQYNLLWFDGANWVDVTPCAMLGQATLACLGDVSGTPSTNQYLKWNGSSWVPDTLTSTDVGNDTGVGGSNLTTVINTINNNVISNDGELADHEGRITALEGAGSGGGGSAIVIAGSFNESGVVTSGAGFTATQLATDVRVDLDTTLTNASGIVTYYVSDVGTWLSFEVNGGAVGTIANFTIPASGGGGRHTVFNFIGAEA